MPATDPKFEQLLEYVRDTRGLDYTGYRRPTLGRRFHTRLQAVGAETWDDYQKFLTTRLTSAPNVSHVKSMMVFRTAKQLPGVPISTE